MISQSSVLIPKNKMSTFKDQGNEAFKSKDFAAAIDFYT